MAGIKATVTTETGLEKTPAPVKKRKKTVAKPNLDKCGCCEKKLEAFVAADGLRFCNDDCVKEFLA